MSKSKLLERRRVYHLSDHVRNYNRRRFGYFPEKTEYGHNGKRGKTGPLFSEGTFDPFLFEEYLEEQGLMSKVWNEVDRLERMMKAPAYNFNEYNDDEYAMSMTGSMSPSYIDWETRRFHSKSRIQRQGKSSARKPRLRKQKRQTQDERFIAAQVAMDLDDSWGHKGHGKTGPLFNEGRIDHSLFDEYLADLEVMSDEWQKNDHPELTRKSLAA